MDSDRDEPRSSNKTLFLILGLVGGIFLLVVLACGGLGYLFMNVWSQAMQGVQSAMQQVQQLAADMQLAESTAQTFLDDISAGRLEPAYAVTAKGFQSRQNMQEFRAFVDKVPGLKNATSRSLISNQAGPVLMRFVATLNGPNGQVTATIDMQKEDEKWKVEPIHRSLTSKVAFTPAPAARHFLRTDHEAIPYPGAVEQLSKVATHGCT